MSLFLRERQLGYHEGRTVHVLYLELNPASVVYGNRLGSFSDATHGNQLENFNTAFADGTYSYRSHFQCEPLRCH